MAEIDVDDIQEVNYSENAVRITFKSGETRVYEGSELAGVLEVLKHWTPPTA